MSAWSKLSLRGSIGRHGAARRFGAWLAVLALVAQTAAMLAPMPAAASAPSWPADSLCLASGSSPASDLPASGGKHTASLHDCQACLVHHAKAALVPPLAVVLAQVAYDGDDQLVTASDASTPYHHDPSTTRPRAPPVG